MRPDVRRLSLIGIALLAWGGAGCGSLRPVGTTTADVAEKQVAHAGPEYRSVVIDPFVVVTNAPPPIVDEAEVLVKAVREQFRELFDTAPTTPTTVWLFASERAYREEAPKLGKVDRTPFYSITQLRNAPTAYFNPLAQELFVFPKYQYGLRQVLVHELVHVYVEANHRRAATWIHEGIASLFGDASRIRDGRTKIGPRDWFPFIMDLSFRTQRLPSVAEVVDASYAGFHFQADAYSFYEVSSFIIYWLHEHRLLRRFLAAYREGANAGVPSAKTLSDVTGRSLADLDADVRRFAKERAAQWRSQVDDAKRRLDEQR